jgi:lipopolysaccharide export system permease protein
MHPRGRKKRKVGIYGDILEKSEKKDTIFNFDLEDLTPVVYIAETLPFNELIVGNND